MRPGPPWRQGRACCGAGGNPLTVIIIITTRMIKTTESVSKSEREGGRVTVRVKGPNLSSGLGGMPRSPVRSLRVRSSICSCTGRNPVRTEKRVGKKTELPKKGHYCQNNRHSYPEKHIITIKPDISTKNSTLLAKKPGSVTKKNQTLLLKIDIATLKPDIVTEKKSPGIITKKRHYHHKPKRYYGKTHTGIHYRSTRPRYQ